MTILETDFKALGARLKHAQQTRKSFVSKLHKLRRGPQRRESIFTDEQRVWLWEVAGLDEVSAHWIGKAGAGDSSLRARQVKLRAQHHQSAKMGGSAGSGQYAARRASGQAQGSAPRHTYARAYGQQHKADVLARSDR
jgi:hypothetical protein